MADRAKMFMTYVVRYYSAKLVVVSHMRVQRLQKLWGTTGPAHWEESVAHALETVRYSRANGYHTKFRHSTVWGFGRRYIKALAFGDSPKMPQTIDFLNPKQ